MDRALCSPGPRVGVAYAEGDKGQAAASPALLHSLTSTFILLCIVPSSALSTTSSAPLSTITAQSHSAIHIYQTNMDITQFKFTFEMRLSGSNVSEPSSLPTTTSPTPKATRLPPVSTHTPKNYRLPANYSRAEFDKLFVLLWRAPRLPSLDREPEPEWDEEEEEGEEVAVAACGRWRPPILRPVFDFRPHPSPPPSPALYPSPSPYPSRAPLTDGEIIALDGLLCLPRCAVRYEYEREYDSGECEYGIEEEYDSVDESEGEYDSEEEEDANDADDEREA
ncbi:hypothetical protein DENSPDRAFT_313031 [Dentipellis sp. KUC8613]|nr:hypothetical protein DENSPDRAFT_313031 [Dentipellis sp. KUC8613]